MPQATQASTDAQPFIDSLGTFGTVLAIKLYRMQLEHPPGVPVLPCLDHEAMLHDGIAPHTAADVQDAVVINLAGKYPPAVTPSVAARALRKGSRGESGRRRRRCTMLQPPVARPDHFNFRAIPFCAAHLQLSAARFGSPAQ